MYISPNSTIKILHNVPLDDTYDHTIYWDTTSGGGGATAQKTYFEGLTKPTEYSPVTGTNVSFTLSAQSYQRVKRGYIRCEIPADMLYDCNYLMFQNTSFGARWFYAFIKSVEYINNKVSEIQFELDVMQTWHFDYDLEECFVEREHTVTDVIGDNTVPEHLEIGDYLFLDAGKAFQNLSGRSDFSVCICASWTREWNGLWEQETDIDGGFYNGIFSGLYFTTIPLDGSVNVKQKLIDYLHGLSEKRKEEIVGIYMIPTDIISAYSDDVNQNAGGKIITLQKHYSWSGGDNTRFEPKNKKLYTYPYNTIYVITSDGDSAYFKYELFERNSATMKFLLEGAMGVPPDMGLTPANYSYDIAPYTESSYEIVDTWIGIGQYIINYTGSPDTIVGQKVHVSGDSKIYTISGAGAIYPGVGITLSPAPSPSLSIGTILTTLPKANYNFTLSVKNFPMCSWVSDSFRAWLAQNSTRVIAGAATTVAGAIATGGVIGATAASSPWMTEEIAAARQTSNMISAGSSVANSLLQVVPAMLQPDHAHGVSKGMLGMANGEFGYHFYYARIKDEYARIIDDYFTRYGYAVKRNKKPNRNARPHWTYTKTIGCTIQASIPAPDTKAICDIYNNGITFWKTPSEIGKYSDYDNSPVTP